MTLWKPAVLMVAIWGSFSLAATSSNYDVRDPFCVRTLSTAVKVGDHTIVPSGRDSDVLPIYTKAVETLFGKGGVCEKLGIPVPPQILTFASSSELALLATLGRHAVAHESDGGTLFNEAASNAGVLEFVLPGKAHGPNCGVCRSYYSDNTNIEAQISILMHVAGHNHFSVISSMARERNVDVMEESLSMHHKLTKYAEMYGDEEVRLWYYQIRSLERMQDLVRGSYNNPDEFDLTKNNLQNRKQGPNPNPISHPRKPTPNILQFLSRNLPPETPQWKLDILQNYERLERLWGWYASDKIINEGWASLMQEIILGHSPFATDDFNFKQATLMTGVAGWASLKNPYWLGREAWRRVRARFNDTYASRNAGKLISPLERDRAFIAYAESIMAQYDDYDFLRMALDEVWVKRNKLHLKRPALWMEWKDIPPSKDPKDTQQWIITSNDSKKVVDWIASKTSDRSRVFPIIDLVSQNAEGRGLFYLRHNSKENHDIPLKQSSMVQTMFVLSQIRQQPVALETRLLVDRFKLQKNGSSRIAPWFPGPWPGPVNQPDQYVFVDLKVEVDASGRVRVASPESKRGAQTLDQDEWKALKTRLQAFVDDYKIEMKGGISEYLTERDEKRFGLLAIRVMEQNTRSHLDISSHSPTAADAILKYMDAVQRALPRKLRLLAEGKLPHTRMKNGGARIRVLPPIPSFGLDQNLFQKYSKSLTEKDRLGFFATKYRLNLGAIKRTEDLPTQIDGRPVAFNSSLIPIPIVNLGPNSSRAPRAEKTPPSLIDGQRLQAADDRLGQGDYEPGDHHWGPGENDDKGDGDDGDEPADGNGDDPGTGPDSGEGDPGVIEIPPEIFAEIVSGQYQLPNLRPKPGREPKVETMVEGARQTASGDPLYNKMMMDILARGREALRLQGNKNPSWVQVLQKGYSLITEDIVRTPDREEVKEPDTRVVVIVVIDMSGSMSGEPYRVVRQVVQNMQIMLKKVYKHVEFRFVGFSGDAHEFGPNEWYGKFIGGGTEYAKGYQLASKIRDEYPLAKYDAIMLTAGDAQDMSSDAARVELSRLQPTLQYNALLYTEVWGGGDPNLISFFTNPEDESEKRFLGFARVTGKEPNPTKEAMDQLFPKKKAPK